MNALSRLKKLTPGQKRLYLGVLILSFYVFANAAYLLVNRIADAFDWRFLALSEIALPKFHQAMVLSHTAAGVLLVGLFGAFAWSHLKTMLKTKKRAAIVSGLTLVFLGVTLSATGLFILTEANSRQNMWVWWIHVVLALGVPALFIAHRAFSASHLPWRAVMKKGVLPLAGFTTVLLAIHMTTNTDIQRTIEAQLAHERGMSTGPGSRDFDRGIRLEGTFRPAIQVTPGESPFFPSSATTTSGDWMPSRIITRDGGYDREAMDHDLDTQGFVSNVLIGAESCQRCHPDVTDGWKSSAHRFSSFNNPWYEATITDMRETANTPNPFVDEHIKKQEHMAGKLGIVKSNWCSGCHDPAVMLAGKMNKDIDRRSAEAQAGLSCLACHAIDKIHGVVGNGAYNIADAQEDPYMFPDARSGFGMFLHDAALRAKPTVHKRQMLKPFFRTSEFCSTCHKVSLDTPVNSYRWIRGQNEYDNWHDSGISLNAARTFYVPPTFRNCQECHMPLVDAVKGDLAAKGGKIRDHRFLAANTALPFIRGDQEQLKKTEEMLRTSMRVEVFAVRSTELSEEPVMAIAEAKPSVPAATDVIFHVVVRNKGVGHTFPGGTIDSNEGWLEMAVQPEGGDWTIVSGGLMPDRQVDPGAHYYRGLIIGEDGKKIMRRDAQNIRVPVYANLVGPGTADLARYRVHFPEEWAGKNVKVRARLLWRKFDQPYNKFAFEKNPKGFAAFTEPPVLPITDMGSHEVTVTVAAPGTPIEATVKEIAFKPEDWMRFNDYGIPQVLRGDTLGARRAFAEVAKRWPQRRDGEANLARVALRDGNLPLAFEHLANAEKVAPGHAQNAYLWGLALDEEGNYERAIVAFQRTLQDWPGDRDTMRRMGRAYYLNGQYQECIDTMDNVLEIDTEDRVAHYHRMLSFKAMGNAELADIAAKAYEKYQIDESAREWVKKYSLNHPEDNLHAQPIFVHDISEVLTGPRGGASGGGATYETETTAVSGAGPGVAGTASPATAAATRPMSAPHGVPQSALIHGYLLDLGGETGGSSELRGGSSCCAEGTH